ncbi:MAG TPA: NADH-ubiquinone oxidoreductase-F iron-sulfur binding region domain-containing protein [Kineosporiaceae bacterium]
MTGFRTVPAGYGGDLTVAVGPRLLRSVAAGAELAAHRTSWAAPQPVPAAELVSRTERVGLRGRGGGGFPFSRKLAVALGAGRRRAVIVNAAEGEPGSGKDSALLLTAPHLVLDGADLVATALDCTTVTVVVPAERPAVGGAVRAAVAQRPGDLGYDLVVTGGTFVSGQARAVVELVEGRENLPVTAWTPEAVSGVKDRPTLLSNAETFAQVAAVCALGVDEYLAIGLPAEPGTTLLTVAGDSPGGVVLEVPFGVALARVLPYCGFRTDGPVLIGGYHGAWLPVEEVARRTISRQDLATVGASIGAGVILPLGPTRCPVQVTASIVEYLAGHSARRCGPCRNGLPALATSVDELARDGGRESVTRVKELVSLVTGRGACAHPDGTARLVRSLFRAFPDELAAHRDGRCALSPLPLSAAVAR